MAARAEFEQWLAEAMRSVATLRAQAPVDSEDKQRQNETCCRLRFRRDLQVQRNLGAVSNKRMRC